MAAQVRTERDAVYTARRSGRAATAAVAEAAQGAFLPLPATATAHGARLRAEERTPAGEYYEDNTTYSGGSIV